MAGSKQTHHVLVTGVPGIGKSELCAAFRRNGIEAAVDADDPGILKWGSRGEPLAGGAHFGWILRNRPKWDLKEVKRLLRENDELYVFGISPSLFRAIPSFDEVIYLHGSRDLVEERLKTRTGNPFGTTDAQRRLVFATRLWLDPLARAVASVSKTVRLLDASKSVQELFLKASGREQDKS